jgi:hypothetical protein
MPKKSSKLEKELNPLPEKYCDNNCKYAKFQKNAPLCHTFDLIYCRKYKLEINKSTKCLDYNPIFQKAYKKQK